MGILGIIVGAQGFKISNKGLDEEKLEKWGLNGNFEDMRVKLVMWPKYIQFPLSLSFLIPQPEFLSLSLIESLNSNTKERKGHKSTTSIC